METDRSINMPQTKIDVATASITYYGVANQSSATSDDDWDIMRKSVSGNVTTYQFAENSGAYPHVWDDRATLNYE